MLMARALGALKVQVDVIVSSPLKRAMQTAQFVGTELGFEGKLELCDCLAPGDDYAGFQQMLATYGDRDGVLVVGHNPFLFQYLGRLITGNGGVSIRLRKGSVACVDFKNHPPRLQWLIDPRSANALLSSATKGSKRKSTRK